MILVLALTIASASARDFDLNFENATLQNNSNGSTNVREDGLLWSPAYENLSSSGFSLPNGGARHGNRSLRIFTPSSTQSGFFRSELWLRNHTRSGLPHYSNRQAITEGTNKHFGFSIKVNGNTGSSGVGDFHLRDKGDKTSALSKSIKTSGMISSFISVKVTRTTLSNVSGATEPLPSGSTMQVMETELGITATMGSLVTISFLQIFLPE